MVVPFFGVRQPSLFKSRHSSNSFLRLSEESHQNKNKLIPKNTAHGNCLLCLLLALSLSRTAANLGWGVRGGGVAGVDSILHLLFKRRGGKIPQSGHISPNLTAQPSFLPSSRFVFFLVLSPFTFCLFSPSSSIPVTCRARPPPSRA